MMIGSSPPESWQELQRTVAQILREVGFTTDVEKSVHTARGQVSIDVWVHDPVATPPQAYLVECKRWRKPIPQTVVHAFRSVIGDAGANWGAIISSSAFQPAAYAAAAHSNVRLITWPEFDALFARRWLSCFFFPTIAALTAPLTEYTHVLTSRSLQKLSAVPIASRARFGEIRKEYEPLGAFGLLFQRHSFGPVSIAFDATMLHLDVPLRTALAEDLPDLRLPDAILDAPSYRALIEEIDTHVRRGLAEFEAFFPPHV